jgi:uncharacterized protein with von Willebrand factor type A (vWA) domain
MNIIESLIRKAKGMLEDAPTPTLTQSVRTNSFDRWDLDDVAAASEAMQDASHNLAQDIDYADELVKDVHAMFFKTEPHLEVGEEMKATHRPNREIIEQLMSMPEVQSLRDLSIGDAVNSAIASTTVAGPVMETAKRVREATKAAEDAAAKAEREAQEAADALDALLQTAQNAQSPVEKEMAGAALQAAMDQIARKQVEMQARQGEQKQAGQQAMKSGAQAMRKAAASAGDEIGEGEAMASSFGTDPGELQKMSAQERIDLAKKLKGNRLKDFMKIIGQFKAVQKAESRKRVTSASTEIHGITLSDNLERLTVGEYLNFASDELETLFWLRFTEKALVTYDVRGKENMGQGPVICVVDESGSMGAADVAGGTREAWSKALSLAMLEQARGRKRDFVYIGFSSRGQTHKIEFPYGESTLEKVLEMTEHFYGGGTYYEQPLEEALAFIKDKYESDPQRQERPDIVFISDDEYGGIGDDFMRRYTALKEKASIKTYGIALGCSAGGVMAQICDDTREITSMVSSDPRALGDMFRTI